MGWRDWVSGWTQSEAYAHPGAPAGGGGPGASVQPGPLGGDHGARSVPHPQSPAARSFDWHRLPVIDLAERVKAVYEALRRCGQYVPSEIEHATGEEVHSLIEGLLPGLLLAIAIMAVTTLGGAAAGAALGALAGGVGAAPGAVAGASLGAEAGAFILEWLGIGFLAVYVGKNIGTAARKATSAIEIAWESVDDPATEDFAITRAAELLAAAVADIFRAVLQGIVAFLLSKGIGAARSRLPELTAKLRASKLGEAFAGWVERSWERLIRNPKLEPGDAPTPRRGGGRVRGAPESSAEEPSAKPAPAPKPARIPVSGARLEATQDGALHNQDWQSVGAKDFTAERPEGLDMENLSPEDRAAAKTLKDGGYSNDKIEQVLNSGNNFTTKQFEAGDPVYAFDSADYVGKDANSPYWMDQQSFDDVKSKFYDDEDGTWDRQGVKNYLALPCYNKADGLVQGQITEPCTGVQSTVGPASETVTYQAADGTVVPESLALPGGGTQVTPPIGAVGPAVGSP